MDMSKAFDKVNRETLLNDMKNIVEKDELHLIKLLLKNVELRVKCGNYNRTTLEKHHKGFHKATV